MVKRTAPNRRQRASAEGPVTGGQVTSGDQQSGEGEGGGEPCQGKGRRLRAAAAAGADSDSRAAAVLSSSCPGSCPGAVRREV